VLNELEETNNWENIFKTYEDRRKKDTDAIADLAIDNFYEMRDHVANPLFQQKRKIEIELEQHFPEQYASKYRLVTFNEDIGYREAMLRGRAQDRAILNLIDDNFISYDEKKETIDGLKQLLSLIQNKVNEIFEDERVANL